MDEPRFLATAVGAETERARLLGTGIGDRRSLSQPESGGRVMPHISRHEWLPLVILIALALLGLLLVPIIFPAPVTQ